MNALLRVLVAVPFVTLSIVGSAANVASAQPYEICIDPGHGGSDPGATGCGLEEADINLDVGQRLAALIAADPDLTSIMTRTTDVFISLSARSAYANSNGANRFVSLHANAFNGSASGIETFHATVSSAASQDQAAKIQAGMIAIWGPGSPGSPDLPNRGVKSANFSVLTNTSMPATLSEIAFVDNCSADAILLANPAELQAAAVAHHNALRASLGLGSIIIDPPDEEGTLQGVAFEDQGVGTADMSIRLPGTTLTVSGPGASQTTTASSPDGNWDFTVEPGTWTVTLSGSGYQTSTRVCDVVANQTSWCSIGMFPNVVTPPDDGPEPEPDTGPEPLPDVGPEPLPDVGPEPEPDLGPEPLPEAPLELTGEISDIGPGPDANVETMPDTSGPDVASTDNGSDTTTGFDNGPGPDTDPKIPDVGTPPDTAGTDESTSQDLGGFKPSSPDSALPPGDSEGCASGTSDGGTSMAWMALLLGLFLMRRRQSPTQAKAGIVAVVAFVGAGLTISTAGSAVAAPGVKSTPSQVLAQSTLHRTVTDLRQLTPRGRYVSPVWSPDSSTVALSRRDLASIWVVPAEGGTPRAVVQSKSAGVRFDWSSDSGSVQYLAPRQKISHIPALASDLMGNPAAAPRNPFPGVWLVITDKAAGERVELRTGRRAENVVTISPAGDRFYDARLSPDGQRVWMAGLRSGIWVYELGTQSAVHLGAGTQPRFSADGTQLVFERTSDNGLAITGSDIVLADLRGVRPSLEVLNGLPKRARRPSLSPDGRHVVFDAGGIIWRASLGR